MQFFSHIFAGLEFYVLSNDVEMKYERFIANEYDAKKNHTILSYILHLKTIQECFNFKYILQLHDAYVTEAHQLRTNLPLSVSIL